MTTLWGLLGALWLQGALAGAGGLLASPLRVAQCRAKCVHTFSYEMDNRYDCLKSTNCKTCWDQCEKLGAGWSAACDHKSTCQAGCRQACRFRLQEEVQRAPVLVTRGEEVISVTRGTASWPPPATTITPAVFVLMCRRQDNTWTQVTQTMELSWSLPVCETVRVMVVGLEGLVTVYSPAPPLTPLQDAEVILRSVGRDPWPSAQDTLPQSLSTDESPRTADQEHNWNLREVSLIHQGVLVIAEVAWDPQPSSYPSVYLVTWELEGGGLKGSLLTDSTCVTLSLWPDTVYRIQVQAVREAGRASAALEVDTRQAAPLLPRAPTRHWPQHPGLEAAAGAAAALLLFLGVTALCRARAVASLKAPSDYALYADHFRLYPPPVRLLVDPSCPGAGVPENLTKTVSPQPAL